MEARAISKAHLPVLTAASGGAAERFAHRMRGRHPAAVFFAALFTGLAVLVLASILLALLTMELLVGELGLGGEDQDVVDTIVDERTPFLTDVSEVGSTVGGAPVLPILVGLVAIAAAFMRKWLIVGFAAFVLAVESATYRITTIVVPRERPDVNRLEDLEADASYPSGHVAASFAVYAGLMILLTSRFPSRGTKIAAWLVAIIVPLFVGLSRMYRGMHHPLDEGGGLLVGAGAVIVLLFACRAADAARATHTGGATRSAPKERVVA